MSEREAILEYLTQDESAEPGGLPVGGRIAQRYRHRQDDAIRAQFPGIDPAKIRRKAFAITGYLHAAEDIEQEVYIELLRKPREKRAEIRSFLALSIIISERLAYRWIRKNRRTPAVSLEGVGEEEQPAVSFQRQLEAENLLEHLLSKLPTDIRAPFLLHGMYGYSIEEVAGLLDTEIEVAKYRIARALRKIRAFLDELPEGLDELPISTISHHREHDDE